MEDFFFFHSPLSQKCKQREGATLYSADRLLDINPLGGAAPFAFLARVRIKRVQRISLLRATAETRAGSRSGRSFSRRPAF